VLPDTDNATKDLGVHTIAIGGDSYGFLYAVAGVCAICGALAILPVTRVR
jgi:hypothetical protein